MFEGFNSNYVVSYFRENSVDMKYNVDIVFVVDATGSMGNLINTIKKMIPDFYRETVRSLAEKNKHVDVLRVKVIFFRDFLEYQKDRCAPLMETDFYILSDRYNDQSGQLSRSIASIEAIGGGDIPEDGLEALAVAMQSDWCKPMDNHKRRHIIVLFTDAPTHEIGYGRACELYPKDMPADFGELTYMWGNPVRHPGTMEYQAKRLILFAPEMDKLPEDDGWKRIVRGRRAEDGSLVEKPWENLDLIQIRPSDEFRDVDFSRILNRIVNSV
ncbi:MAG: VWA domain-containing protein [Oscillospiraceae bacterium]|nr:VWA domain-containing protein [Oscillospiraceae bacterium]